MHSVVACFYEGKLDEGCQVGMDNLYNSVDFSQMLASGATFILKYPKTVSAPAEEHEWVVKGILTVGTLRGNRGSEKAHLWSDNMAKAAGDALREKPLVPDRVKLVFANLFGGSV